MDIHENKGLRTLFKDKTVFVVGAGASAEYGLPVGTELAEIIADSMWFKGDGFGNLINKDDPTIYFALKNHFKGTDKLNKHFDAARKIHEGIKHVDSIDNFLDMHHNDKETVFCGKTAIVKAILDAEERCQLSYDTSNIYNTIDFDRVNKSWLKPFFKQLTLGRPKPDIEKVFEGITIICFNYDRCIEHYLIRVLNKAYSIDLKDAAKLVASLEIYHPYGTVGELHTPLNPQGVAFGAELKREGLISAAQGIHTYTEQIEDQNTIDKVKQAIANAKSLVFLGFAYHKQNIDMLKPDKPGRISSIFGTAYNLSDYNVTEVKSRVRSLAHGEIPILEIDSKNLMCGPFLDHYEMGL
jgi:hypothetical protein